jgi:WD40 repeat protein
MGTNRADALSNAAGGGAAARGGGGPVQLEAAIPIKNSRSTFESVHQGPVWALAKKDNTYLFSGSSDTNIQVWDLENQKPLHTLAGHKSIVHSMDIYQNTLISGSDDRTLKFWDIAETWKCTKTIRTNNVACVLKVASGCLFAGSFKCVKVWNLDTFEFVTNIEAHNHWVRALNITKGHLFTGGYNAINVRTHPVPIARYLYR